MKAFSGFLRIFKLATTEKLKLVAATSALLVTSSLSLLYPQLVKFIVDEVKPGMNPSSLNRYVVLLILLFLLLAVITGVRMFLFDLAGEKIVIQLRKKLFETLMNQDMAFFDNEKSGALLSRLAADTTLLQSAATVQLSMFLRFSIATIGSFVILLFTSWELTIVMGLLVPPSVVMIRLYGRWIRKLSAGVQDEIAEASSLAEQTLAEIKMVQALNSEKALGQRYGASLNRAYQLAKSRSGKSAVFGGIASFLGFATICCVLWYGGHLYLREALTLGELTSFLLYTFTIAFSVGALGTVWQTMMRAIGASDRVFELLDQEPLIKSGSVVLDVTPNIIRLEELTFHYPTRPEIPALKSVSLTLMRGKKTALVGQTGSGKSTIAALLCRLYDPQSGTIIIDGTSLGEIDLQTWRRQIGVVFQEHALFNFSIRDNLKLGNTEATDTTLWQALEQARLSDFVRALPQGLDTTIGDRGVQLSGGQKQRLSIARLLVKDPAIVILDEATSALDAKTEAEVVQALDSLLMDRTSLVIAHRLSTVVNADHIVCLHEGSVLSAGSHEFLLKNSPEYEALISSQLINAPQVHPKNTLGVSS